MAEHRNIIAILRGITSDETISVCHALADAGVTMIEIPLNSPNAVGSIELAAAELGSRLTIGAGTVLSVEDVDRIAGVGGQFIVSPDCNPEVIRHTRARGLASYPGVFTPTEAFQAIRAGANGLKMFPAEILGPAGIKAMKAVLPPDMPVYAVGGANPDNLDQYFATGCSGFGVGSYFYRPGYALEDIGQRARQFVAAYDQGKSRAD